VQVLIDGLRAHGADVAELNAPLGLSTAERVRILQQPWRVPALLVRIARRWIQLALGSRRYRGARRVDSVVVGYLGHFDVFVARVLFPRTTIVLDHLIFAGDTAVDRGAGLGLRTRLLNALDRLALGAADIVVVDTPEHRELVPRRRRPQTVVVPVGATTDWFAARRPAAARGRDEPCSLVFFGMFTPLHGAATIGRALRLLHERDVPILATLVGQGQDEEEVRDAVAGLAEVTWLNWVDGPDLPALVAERDICLGIFGTTDKARRVVPNKVYQGAAAGAAVITSDTAPQRRVLAGAAVLVPPGDALALADAIEGLARDPALPKKFRSSSAHLADDSSNPRAVTERLMTARR
jgi:glycosyltransferase involved in cell wall biosynthesis